MELRANVQGLDHAPPKQFTISFQGLRTVGSDGVESAFNRVLEASFPLAPAGIAAGQGLRFQFSLWQGGLPLDAVPQQGWIEVEPAAE